MREPRVPRHPDGLATRKSGDPNGSLQYYQQALALDARHLGAHEHIGEAYLMLERPKEADQLTTSVKPDRRRATVDERSSMRNQ